MRPSLPLRTGKDSDARRDWGQEEKGTTEDEMAGWHHQINAKAKRSVASLGLDFVESEDNAIWGCFYKDNDTGL